MAFDTYSNNNAPDSTSGDDRPKVDWDALNKYVVETANLQERETLVGYIAGIVDLGTQDQEDAEAVFDGDAAKEEAIIAEKPDTYFKDGVDDKGKPVRLKCWPQKPVQCVTFAVDFPEIMLNKGQFFDDPDAEEKPLRLWLGGQFYLKDAGMVVGRPLPLRWKNIAPDGAKKPIFSLALNHQIYKMAVGAKLIKPGEPFLPTEIDKLLGQSLQFEAQVFFKTSKGKDYYSEYIKFVSGLGRGQKPCELVTKPFVVQVNQKNDKEALAEVRNHVINTIKRASNYPGSMIEKELAEVKGNAGVDADQQGDDTPAPTPAPKPSRAPVREVTSVASSGFVDDDVPFANPYRGRICLVV